MSLPVRTRFEVFKRDRFTCAYCGKTPPDVLLEVDHIQPQAAGGSDDLVNLVTACQDCNRGKSSNLLGEGVLPAVNVAAVEEMEERLEQTRAYMEATRQSERLRDEMVWRVNEAWGRAYGAVLEETDEGSYLKFESYGRFPDERSIRRILRQLSFDQVLEAVDITAGRFKTPTHQACLYFYGVCYHRIRGDR